jgi:hypothetical protein
VQLTEAYSGSCQEVPRGQGVRGWQGEGDRMKKKRASFKSRHGKNIAKGKMSAAYWADKSKWKTGGLV